MKPAPLIVTRVPPIEEPRLGLMLKMVADGVVAAAQTAAAAANATARSMSSAGIPEESRSTAQAVDRDKRWCATLESHCFGTKPRGSTFSPLRTVRNFASPTDLSDCRRCKPPGQSESELGNGTAEAQLADHCCKYYQTSGMAPHRFLCLAFLPPSFTPS